MTYDISYVICIYIYVCVCALVFLIYTRLYIEGFSPRSRSKNRSGRWLNATFWNVQSNCTGAVADVFVFQFNSSFFKLCFLFWRNNINLPVGDTSLLTIGCTAILLKMWGMIIVPTSRDRRLSLDPTEEVPFDKQNVVKPMS